LACEICGLPIPGDKKQRCWRCEAELVAGVITRSTDVYRDVPRHKGLSFYFDKYAIYITDTRFVIIRTQKYNLLRDKSGYGASIAAAEAWVDSIVGPMIRGAVEGKVKEKAGHPLTDDPYDDVTPRNRDGSSIMLDSAIARDPKNNVSIPFSSVVSVDLNWAMRKGKFRSSHPEIAYRNQADRRVKKVKFAIWNEGKALRLRSKVMALGLFAK
jgi:hypothetical protein